MFLWLFKVTQEIGETARLKTKDINHKFNGVYICFVQSVWKDGLNMATAAIKDLKISSSGKAPETHVFA